jgi:hypothetical protein
MVLIVSIGDWLSSALLYSGASLEMYALLNLDKDKFETSCIISEIENRLNVIK